LDHDLAGAEPAVYRVERADATFLLSGTRSREVLAQTCGVNFAAVPAHKLVMTRVAVATCSILPQPIGDLSVYRMWTDYTYAPYLWQTLLEIIDELGGGVVGAQCHYPGLAP
jgi:sarcosine oxidase subunit gamma